MPAAKRELQAECIRLRTQERMSLRDIHLKTGASKGSLSNWLKPYPLTETEKEGRKAPVPVSLKKARGEESWLHKVVRGRGLNGIQVAKVSETAALLRMLAQGFVVFGSVFDGDKADWVVEVPGLRKHFKVQVKTAHSGQHGLPSVSLRHGASSRNGAKRYEDGDFDFLIGHDLFTDICYVWSWAELSQNKSGVSIHADAAENWGKFFGV